MPTVKMDTLWLSRLTFEGRAEYRDQNTPGLWLRVGESTCTWFLLYKARGKTQRVKIGTYPAVSLADARKEAVRLRSEIYSGGNPAEERRKAKEKPTFQEVTDEYLKRHAVKKRTKAEDERIISRELLPRWKNTRVDDITRRNVRDLLDDIVERGSPIMANRSLALVRKVFNFALERDILDNNPCTRIKPPGKETSRERWLKDDEIRAVWEAFEEEPVTADVFKMLLLTGQRMGEVTSIQWRDIDLNARTWTIPGERAKNGHEHSVPFSEPALEILQARPRKNEWVFPSPRLHVGHIQNLGKAHQRIEELSGVKFHIHDLRRTAATGMARLGIDRVVIAKVLNHTDRSVTAVYERHGYDSEKRHALDVWGNHVMRVVGREAAKVLTLPTR